jgi:hypothetical protein
MATSGKEDKNGFELHGPVSYNLHIYFDHPLKIVINCIIF